MMYDDELKDFLSKAQADEPVVRKVRFPDLEPASGLQNMKIGFDYLLDVQLQVTVELGGASIMIKDLLELQAGSMLELNRTAGDNVDILVNRQHLARGEVIVIGNNFGIRVERIYLPEEIKEGHF